MEKHERISAITQSLPGLEFFLKDVLANETLSAEADKQRQEFIKKLEILQQPPLLPPRPKHLALNRKRSKNHYDRRSKQHNSHYSGTSTIISQESPYKNDTKVDPIEFASKQRELARNITLYKNYAARKDVQTDIGNRCDNFESTISDSVALSKPQRSSILSSSSCEDDIYEHLSNTTPLQSPLDKEPGQQKAVDSFVFGSPPTGGGALPVNVDSRCTSTRGSGGKGKHIYGTGWFKKEQKVYEAVLPSSLKDPSIQGWLKDVKSNKRRLCIIKDHHFYIFKNQEEPAIQILNLPDCDIAVDDKKKISYSFRLTPQGGSPVALAIEEGHDLSPWMSTIMAAVVRKSMYRPTSPIDGAVALEEARQRAHCQVDVKIDETQDIVDSESPYERPVDFGYDNWLLSSSPVLVSSLVHSTPKDKKESLDDVEHDRYDPPLPAIPSDTVDGVSSSSESSSDDDDDEKEKQPEKNFQTKRNSRRLEALEKKLGVSKTSLTEENKRDSFYDTQSEHSNWQSCSEPLASDDTGSSDPRLPDVNPVPVIRSDSMSSRKRTSTVLSSRSMDSFGSDLDLSAAPESSQEKKTSKFMQPPKLKKRRKLTSAESEKQFLQDPSAAHCGKLYQKRRLGVWTKRYCKIVDNRLKCYRHPDDEKPCIDFPLFGYDITLIDSKESKKGYAFKISHPNMEAYYFATDSRNSVERWIEMLSLAATGQLENAAPYLPFFSSGVGGDASIDQSQESLVSSEDALDRDSLDGINNSQGSPQLLQKHQSPYDDVSEFAATDECEDDASSDAREAPQLKEHECQKQQTQHTGVNSHGSGNVLKRNRELTSSKEIHSGGDECETPGTMSPPHSVFIAESQDASNRQPVPHDEKSKEEQKKEKEKKGWTEALRLRRGTLGRRPSLEQVKDRASTSDLQTYSKYKPNTIKKSGHSFAHLVTLFDREGKFSGFLTEIKTGKLSTTHLRRWCVVRNGVLHIYTNESEDNPVCSLSLVEMFVTEDDEEEKKKFTFQLHDKEEKVYAFQSNSKAEFQKWMGVLNLFTDLRNSPEKSQRPILKKLDSGSTSDEGYFERSAVHSKSARYTYDRGKNDDSSHSPPGKRQSLKTKFSQRVNVREIFRKSHSSYDMADILTSEENTNSSTDVNTVTYTGGILTELNVSEESYVRNIKRWCTIKGKWFFVYTDHEACDPVRRISLDNAWVIDNSDPLHKIWRFQITIKNEQLRFLAADQADLNRWLKNLEEAVSGPSEDEPTTRCALRIPSPGIKMHRRTQSESFAQKMMESERSSVNPAHTEEKWTSTGSFRSSASNFQLTDKLMASYLQEMHEKNGAVTLLRRWCVATSETFLVYYNEESDKPLKSWNLTSIKVENSGSHDTGLVGFCLRHAGKVHCYQHTDQVVIKQWLSIFARYCDTSKDFDNTTNQLPRQRYKKSASDNDIKVKREDRKLFRVFSEGRASGEKLIRKISDDGFFPLRKFSRPELLRSSFRSFDKADVKLRDKSSLSSCDPDRRYSSGSLFDSDGKFSSFLMELSANDMCKSQVRRWCVLKDDFMLVYDFENCGKPRKIIPLENAKVTKQADYENSTFLLNIVYSEDEEVNFRAMSRTDLEKWATVISVKNAVIRSRSEKDLRRQSREFQPRISEQAPSVTDLRHIHDKASNSSETEKNLLYPRGNPYSATSSVSGEWRPKSHSLSSITPSEDSVFTTESRVDDVGIAAAFGATGWKFHRNLDSSEGSTDEEPSDDNTKGLFPGETLKDFVNLVLSSSEEVNPETVNAAEQTQTERTLQASTGRVESVNPCDSRTDTNPLQSTTHGKDGDIKQNTECLELNLKEGSASVECLSPSREITVGFERINLRERSGSDASNQDTYFGPPTPNRNSLESTTLIPDRLAFGGKDVIEQWLEDLTENVTRNTSFKASKNQCFESVNRIEQLSESSIRDDLQLESPIFESNQNLCSFSGKKELNSTEESVRSFLEEVVDSIACRFAKTMFLTKKSPKSENRCELLSDYNDSLECKNVSLVSFKVDTKAESDLPEQSTLQNEDRMKCGMVKLEEKDSEESTSGGIINYAVEYQDLAVEGIPEDHSDTISSSCEDIRASAFGRENDANGKEFSILDVSNQDSTTQMGMGATAEATRCYSTDSGFVSDSWSRGTLESERTVSKADSVVFDAVKQKEHGDKPNVDHKLDSSEKGLLSFSKSPEVPNTKVDENQKSSVNVDSSQQILTPDQLSRSQTDIINAVNEAFQCIIDLEEDNETETKL